MYTIGQVSKMFGLPVSTLRYYDNQGLFPDMKRENGIRRFSQAELEALRVIDCLKCSGLEIKEIKQFMDLCRQGRSSYGKRKHLFLRQRRKVEEDIRQMNKVLDMLKFKCWYYDTAIADGNEDRLKTLPNDDMPPEIKQAYINAHSK